MAKKGPRQLVRMRSTESHHVYLTSKNRRNDDKRLELRKFESGLAQTRGLQGDQVAPESLRKRDSSARPPLPRKCEGIRGKPSRFRIERLSKPVAAQVNRSGFLVSKACGQPTDKSVKNHLRVRFSDRTA